MVELDSGCYHITCRCGHQFCYTCGAEWKNKKATCDCPLWDEHYAISLDSNMLLPIATCNFITYRIITNCMMFLELLGSATFMNSYFVIVLLD
ncbi:unnamed protein product [Prunus brigantina]